MIEQQGIVIGVRDGLAEVDVKGRHGCGGCGEQGSCATAAIGNLFTRRRHRIRVNNSIGASTGDVVVIGLRDDDALGLAAVAYLVPVVTMILGAGAGEALVRLLATPSEFPVVLGAAAGLFGGLGLFRRLGGRNGGPADRVVLLRKEPKPSPLVTLS